MLFYRFYLFRYDYVMTIWGDLMDYVMLGNAIRKKRKETGWTIADLADHSNISEDFIGKIERGTDVPSIQTLVSIANALNVGLDYLIGNDLEQEAYLYEDINKLLDEMSAKNRKTFLQFIEHNVKFFKSI